MPKSDKVASKAQLEHASTPLQLSPALQATQLGEASDQSQRASSSTQTGAEDPQKLDVLRNQGEGQHGCIHYRRRCQLVAPCCEEVFWCRHCHNEKKQAAEWVRPNTPLSDRSTLQAASIERVLSSIAGFCNPMIRPVCDSVLFLVCHNSDQDKPIHLSQTPPRQVEA